MPIARAVSAWRPAALRGLSRIADGEEALIALNVGQYLRMRIEAGRAEAFRERLGRRVWVDLDAWSVRLDEPFERGHE